MDLSLPVILHRNLAQEVYLLEDVYDPSTDGAYESSGKQVPAVGALVVDRSTNPRASVLYYVEAVDGVTYAATITPISLASGAVASQLEIAGANLASMFFDYTGESPWRLMVDVLVALNGDMAAVYTLSRIAEDGTETAISNISSVDLTPQIPLTENETTGFFILPDCVTSEADLVDGERIMLRLYDSGGVEVGRCELVAKAAMRSSDYAFETNPVVSMAVVPTQLNLDGDIEVYYGQNVGELGVTITLTFANGSTYEVPAEDEGTSFVVHGLDIIDTGRVGAVFPVIVKYKLPDNFASAIPDYDGTNRWLTAEFSAWIVNAPVDRVTKISPLLYLNGGAWTLKWLAYCADRPAGAFVTPDYVGDAPDLTSSDCQTVSISYEYTTSGGVTLIYLASFQIRVEAPVADRFKIDTSPDHVLIYGDQSTAPPPVLYRNTSTGELSVDSESIVDETAFLAVFYDRAIPPFSADVEAGPPVPTHFRLRKMSDGTVVTTADVPIADYADPIGLDPTYAAGELPALPAGAGTLIMEFVYNTGTPVYLYGVPVHVEEISPT